MLGLAALVVVGLGLAYFLFTVGAGLVPRPDAAPAPPASSDPVAVFFLIACLDEELVVVDTVTPLLRDARARVVVVDDGSTDRTAELAAAVDPERVEVVARTLPEARLGKGRALNAGFARIVELVEAEGLDPARVLVGVMDADGRLSDGALDAVVPLFDDPEVGGAQLMVRIRNRSSLLGRIQDIEFFGLTATSQMGRRRTGTVSLGGNGQFTRLAALRELGDAPWSSSLTEDLDLTISLLARGWTLTSTRRALVTQQAVERLGPLLRQRTRWYQGHMTCGRRLPELLRSPSLSHAGVLEIAGYLAVPWLLVLPWSILFHVGVWQIAATLRHEGWSVFGDGAPARILGITLWYGLLFFPSLLSGYAYHRRAHGTGRVRSFLLGHLLIPAAYVSYIACWWALIRIVRRQGDWVKTRRAQEPAHPSPASRAPHLEPSR